MFAVVAIAPLGTEMVCSVHETQAEAEREAADQLTKRGHVWSFDVRECKPVVD